jgi:hypothetical protein
MRAESTISPTAVQVEVHDGLADIVLADNITLIDRDGEGRYVYDEYRITVPDRPGLQAAVEAYLPDWLAAAKDMAAVVVPVPLPDRVTTVEEIQSEVIDLLASALGVTI